MIPVFPCNVLKFTGSASQINMFFPSFANYFFSEVARIAKKFKAFLEGFRVKAEKICILTNFSKKSI